MSLLLAQLRKNRLLVTVIVADIVFFGAVSPNAHAAVIFPAFLLAITTIWILSRLLVNYLNVLTPLKVKTQKKIILLLVVGTGFLLALQSVGQLTVRDVLTLLPLIAIITFYMSYSRSTTNR